MHASLDHKQAAVVQHEKPPQVQRPALLGGLPTKQMAQPHWLTPARRGPFNCIRLSQRWSANSPSRYQGMSSLPPQHHTKRIDVRGHNLNHGAICKPASSADQVVRVTAQKTHLQARRARPKATLEPRQIALSSDIAQSSSL